jgi:hypothetical protein
MTSYPADHPKLNLLLPKNNISFFSIYLNLLQAIQDKD